MKTITFFFISCFVLFTTAAKAEINYVPNVVHGFSLISNQKQHRDECKNNGGTWDYRANSFLKRMSSCDLPKLNVAPLVRPKWTMHNPSIPEFKHDRLSFYYSFYDPEIDACNKANQKYVENSWLEYLYKTYGEPTSFGSNEFGPVWQWLLSKNNNIVLVITGDCDDVSILYQK